MAVPIILANGEGGVGVQTAIEALRAGFGPLDALEAGIRVVELDPGVRSVGFGSPPNLLGEMECDASVMCGDTLRTGAVGALKEFFHAISVARQVVERTPHVLLVGEGAHRFAGEIGEERGNLLSEEAGEAYERWLREHIPPGALVHWPTVPLAPLLWPSAKPETAGGTTCYLVRAADGNWAGGVSTSGWAYKHPGRLGDSPIIGAGLYVDNRFGGAACTHTGEMTIRAGTARAVVAYMKKGASVSEACHEALDDLSHLRGGYLGPVVLLAVDREGTPCVASIGLENGAPYWFWQGGMPAPECRRSEH